MSRSFWCLIVCLLALAVPRSLPAQPAFLVEDINTDGGQASSGLPSDFAVLGTTLFFIHGDGIHGFEIWKSDGTEAGTGLLMDLCPGLCSSAFSLTVSGGVLFFIADDGAHGLELWKSDGTVPGTVLVKDIRPGVEGSLRENFPTGLFEADGVLYFAADDGAHGPELWKSDGTASGTVLVQDIHPGPNGSDPWPWAAANGALLLQADDGVHGREPWVSDGSEAGTALVKDVNPGPASSVVISGSLFDEDRQDAIAAPWGEFLFQANDGSHGPGLWKTNGTSAGTVLVKDIDPFGNAKPSGFVAFGSSVYFAAFDEVNGRELWKTDGTAAGTVLVKDINPGSRSSNPAWMTASGSRMFLRAFTEVQGNELWASDGTGAGTALVKDVIAGDTSGLGFSRNGITPFGSDVLFFADGGLWRSDGTAAGTVPVPGAQDLPASEYVKDTWAVAGGSFFFSTLSTNGTRPSQLWKSDGTLSVLVPTAVGAPWSLHPDFRASSLEPLFAARGSRAVFAADQANTVFNLWASDGTASGTDRLSSAVASGFTPAGSLLFLALSFDLATTDGTSAGTQTFPNLSSPFARLAPFGSSVLYACGPREGFPRLYTGLCKSDGTLAGTGLFTEIDSAVTPYRLQASGGQVYFVAGDLKTGEELWKTDGTEAGTGLVRDISAEGGSSPDRLTDVGGTLFFSAATPDEGRELWKSDGTEAGTVLVKDVRLGSGSSIAVSLVFGGSTTAVGNTLFFVADDGVSGSELWKSDGTAAGTVLVEDVSPGSAGSEPFALTRVGGRVYFVADDGVHGRELWVSDGTAAGTRLVADILPGPGSSVPQDLRAVGHVLLFAATDGVHGLEAWRTNGTAAGTRMIQDIAPGDLPSSPASFTAAGDFVFFAANDGATGMEPWAVPRASVLNTFINLGMDSWAWSYVEALAAAGLTNGCGAGQYCAETSVSRAETAAFLLRGIHGVDYAPPVATGTVFDDVPAGYWAAPWIEQFAAEGFTNGCSLTPPLYCPAQPLSRAEMAIFLLRAKHGTGYTPPPASGTVFTDVPLDYWAAPWIEQLAAEGITVGCAPGQYCPETSVNRAQMAVFLTRTFSLPLP